MRVYVAVNFGGSVQYFQRDREERDKSGNWFAQPYFVIDRKLATQMDDTVAKILVNRLRVEFHESPWLESVETRERIDVPRDGSGTAEERKAVAATLNDVDWYVIKPANLPAGPKWFVHVKYPDRVGDPEPVYADTPLGVLERIQSLGWMSLIEDARYIPPAPAAPTQPSRTLPRLRPGSY